MIIQRKIYKQISKVIKSPEAIVITGMRRVGKTTLMKQIFDELKTTNKIFLDLENPINQKIFDEVDFDRILDNLQSLGINIDHKSYVFLDEIQLIKSLPSVVKYLFDHYQIKFIMSGSASYYLKNHFSESLAGRKYIFEMYPLDWQEFLALKQIKTKIIKVGQPVSSYAFVKNDRYYSEFIKYGGFPGVIQKSSPYQKNQSLNDIFSSYYQLEISQLSDFQKLPSIRNLILLLAKRIGQKIEIQKLSQELGISRETVVNYLTFLESTYLIHLIKPFSRNKDVEIRKTAKIYFCDTGLAIRLGATDEGAIFENTIFNSLRTNNQINYYQKKTGQEIDFILNQSKAYEVKLFPSLSDWRRLQKLSKQLKISQNYLVSRRYASNIKCIYGFQL